MAKEQPRWTTGLVSWWLEIGNRIDMLLESSWHVKGRYKRDALCTVILFESHPIAACLQSVSKTLDASTSQMWGVQASCKHHCYRCFKIAVHPQMELVLPGVIRGELMSSYERRLKVCWERGGRAADAGVVEFTKQSTMAENWLSSQRKSLNPNLQRYTKIFHVSPLRWVIETTWVLWSLGPRLAGSMTELGIWPTQRDRQLASLVRHEWFQEIPSYAVFFLSDFLWNDGENGVTFVLWQKIPSVDQFPWQEWAKSSPFILTFKTGQAETQGLRYSQARTWKVSTF